MQAPSMVQASPSAQFPQLPPQPSGPQILSVQLGTHSTSMQTPLSQVISLPHSPQLPPQPSGPQSLPSQSVAHSSVLHLPASVQIFPSSQAPQEPSQPSSPQTFPWQLGWQASDSASASSVSVPAAASEAAWTGCVLSGLVLSIQAVTKTPASRRRPMFRYIMMSP